MRDVYSKELSKAVTKGFEENSSKSEMSKLSPSLIKTGWIFSDQKKYRQVKTSPSTEFQAQAQSAPSKANRKANL